VCVPTASQRTSISILLPSESLNPLQKLEETKTEVSGDWDAYVSQTQEAFEWHAPSSPTLQKCEEAFGSTVMLMFKSSQPHEQLSEEMVLNAT